MFPAVNLANGITVYGNPDLVELIRSWLVPGVRTFTVVEVKSGQIAHAVTTVGLYSRADTNPIIMAHNLSDAELVLHADALERVAEPDHVQVLDLQRQSINDLGLLLCKAGGGRYIEKAPAMA